MISYTLSEDLERGSANLYEYAVHGRREDGTIVSRTQFRRDRAAAEAFLAMLNKTTDGDYRRAMDLGFESLLAAQGYARGSGSAERVLIDIAHAYAHLASVAAKAYQP